MKIILVLAILGLATFAYAENWAVLVAGSDGYWNYRHQADTCHAYQILIQGGIKPENIIHFAKNDVAHNYRNPIPGSLYNKPDPTGAGVNVYDGCKIDYQGSDVTPENFLKVIKGESTAKLTKVLQSTSADNVFIYFADHGAPDLIAFPSSYLYKKDLWPALQTMKTKNMYKQLTFYIEACESGSMCTPDDLTTGSDIYCVTAANATQSSWAAYCGSEAKVNGKDIGSCLGDAFSVNWMEDTDANARTRTLQQQYEAVKALTTRSQCLQWINTAFTNEAIGKFQGMGSVQTNSFFTNSLELEDNRMTKLNFLRREMEKNPGDKEKEMAYAVELHLHNFVAKVMKDLGKLHGIDHEKIGNELPTFDKQCYADLIETFEKDCQKIPEHGLPYLKIFAHICSKNAKLNKTIFSQLLSRVCVPIVQE